MIPIFKIWQDVRIIPLDLNGVIKSIWIDNHGIQYNVRYFWNSEAKEIFFLERELRVI